MKFKIIKLVEIKFMGIFNRRVKTGFCNFVDFILADQKRRALKVIYEIHTKVIVHQNYCKTFKW